MRRPQFSLKTMLWLMAVVAAFAGGIQFERELRRRDNLANQRQTFDFFIGVTR